MSKKILDIPLKNIKVNPLQPRQKFKEEELLSLKESICQFGVLQPITVQKKNNGYEIVMGERRFRAAQMAGLTCIPAILTVSGEKTTAIMALVENLQRVDLNFFEEAQGIQRLISIHNMSQKDVGKTLGKNPATISNKLRLLQLPLKIRKSILDASLSERHARALLKLESEENQERALNKIIENKLTVKKSEEFIEKLNQIPKKKKKIKRVFSTQIYINTLRYAYKEIKKTGIQASFHKNETDEYIEVVVKIPKKQDKNISQEMYEKNNRK